MQSMRTFALLGLLVAGLAYSGQAANTMVSGPNPISKVIQLISGLQAKVVAEGETEQKAYEEFAEWCEDTSKEKSFEIKTHKGEAEDLAATIEKAAADIETFSSKVEDLSGVIGTDTADLKAATTIRAKEHADFDAEARMLSDTIDTLSRAQSVLQKELGASALIQQDSAAASNAAKAAKPFISALRTILEATGLSSEDKTKLAALMQENQGSEDTTDAQMLGAPAAANYESHSGGIIDTLADMQEKAEAELDEKQKAEMKAKQNFELLKLSLEDQIKANQKELDGSKKSIAEAEETKAAAAGELEATQKDLKEVEKTLADVHADCMARATAFEGAVQERNAELEALATAKKIIQETTGGAADRSYAADFLQTSMKTHTRAKAHAKATEAMKQYRAVKIVKNLARKTHSMILAQLADRVAEALRAEAEGTTGADPFAKVKGMISEMIEKLVKEAQEEATKKAYCDKEMSKTKKSKEEGETAIADLTTKIDKADAKIAKLKQEVSELQRELAALAESQAKMDKMRIADKDAYEQAKAELEQGLSGVEMAMKVLKDYYAKSDDATALVQDDESRSVTEMMQEHARMRAPATGAASGIIGMLEVAASDFSKNLADIEAEESAAAEEYDRQTKDNQVTNAEKTQDVKYKKKERKSLEKIVSEANEDRSGVQTELNAVLEYYDKLKPECIAKPEPYEERKRRREEEIAGLKEASGILEGEAVFLQIRSTKQHHLRGNQ